MPVLVLNASLQPLSVITERRLVTLYFKEKVAFLSDDIRQHVEQAIIARQLEIHMPVIVRLHTSVTIPYVRPKATRANILLRDNYTCRYCGKRERELTLDHIVPRSKGGINTWNNLVTCCKTCNGKKGDKSLQNAHMRLLSSQENKIMKPWYFLQRYPELHQAYNEIVQGKYT